VRGNRVKGGIEWRGELGLGLCIVVSYLSSRGRYLTIHK
jgi:hypothetical protein